MSGLDLMISNFIYFIYFRASSICANRFVPGLKRDVVVVGPLIVENDVEYDVDGKIYPLRLNTMLIANVMNMPMIIPPKTDPPNTAPE